MTTYKGDAILLAEDGREFETEAELTKDSSGSWRGTLTFRDVTLFRALLNISDGHLLIDRKTGEFVRPDTSDWTASPAGPQVMRILGSGEAPF
ncbi:hypothetical protein [Streptomyces acidicola]|uniref:Uncharacterized protein n=1 Tax=Streptomyces acidicola TaxID=2596892 RepID=A0A5N8WIC7_9ACTN|nr:hypothetical protein [Streptomyces acidicola]MPY47181.1 hypothetical protein [Streptomyces acidicola]MPY47320.1 hypothetical protein [Streptomyces acidicola]